MITFVIKHLGPDDHGSYISLEVTTHRNRVLAEAWANRNGGQHFLIVDKEEDLPGSASAELLAIYRAIGEVDGPKRAVSRGLVFLNLDQKFNNQPYADLPHPHERSSRGQEKTMTEPTASTAKAPKAAKAKAPKTTKAAAAPKASRSKGKPAGKVADFKQVKDGSRRAEILKLMDGTNTAEQIGVALTKHFKTDFPTALVSSNIFCLQRDCAIGYSYDATGKVTAVYPGSKTMADALKSPSAEKPAKTAKTKAPAKAKVPAKVAKAPAAKKNAAPPAAAATA